MEGHARDLGAEPARSRPRVAVGSPRQELHAAPEFVDRLRALDQVTHRVDVAGDHRLELGDAGGDDEVAAALEVVVDRADRHVERVGDLAHLDGLLAAAFERCDRHLDQSTASRLALLFTCCSSTYLGTRHIDLES